MAKDVATVQAQRLSGNVGDVLTKTENGVKWQAPQGGTGAGIPEGGTVGQVLSLNESNALVWRDVSFSGVGLPEGGVENDVLARNADGGLCWLPIPAALEAIRSELLELWALHQLARLTVVHATGDAPEGAAWDVDSDSDWHVFGYTATVNAGAHSVGFKPLIGHVAPDRQSVSLGAGSAVTVSATYDSQPGVTVNAYGDVPSGAFWSIAPATTPTDTLSYAYGSTQGIEPGQYVIQPSGYSEYDTAADGFTWDDTLLGYPITVVDGAGLVVNITYTARAQQPATPAAYSVQSVGNSITGTFTLEENITTTYDGAQYPVYKNGSMYLAMRSNGRPAINGSADGASTYGWIKSGYTAGADMTAESLSGEWDNGPDNSEDELTFTEVAG